MFIRVKNLKLETVPTGERNILGREKEKLATVKYETLDVNMDNVIYCGPFELNDRKNLDAVAELKAVVEKAGVPWPKTIIEFTNQSNVMVLESMDDIARLIDPKRFST